MGKKDKNKKKGKGAEKTAMKTDKKLIQKQKRLLAKLGEKSIEEVVSNLEAEESRLKEVTEIICPPPSARSNFTLCSHPEKDELILFGGEFYNGQKVCVYNDLFFYSVPKNEWKIVKSPRGPAARSGHQMCSVATDGGQLWVFGGEHASPSQTQYYHYKDLWVYRLSTKTWEKINASNGPSPRSGHRMVASKKKLIVFGGFHDNNISYKYFNDVHMFSLESYTWLPIEIGGPIQPPPRSGCCIAASPEGKILIWGGYSKTPVKKDIDRGTTHTDMFVLTPDKTNAIMKMKWSAIKPGGLRPLPRSGVGCTVAPNGKAYCFGGVMDVEEDEENILGQYGDDLHSLDLSTITWRLIEICKKKKKEEKPGSVDEEMKEMNAEETVTTDGVFTVTVGPPSSGPVSAKSLVDRTPKLGPSSRSNAGLAICKGTLFLYGGLVDDDSKQCTLGDFYSLDLHKLDEWKTIIPNNLHYHEWIDSDSGSSASDGSDEDSSSEDSDSESDMDTN